MEGRYAGENRAKRRWTRGRAKAALGEDLLRRWAALECGWLCRRDPGCKREPIRRGGGDRTGRVRLLPRRLGARRLGAASVILGTAAVFFMAAASTGLIPGVAPLGHGYD